MRNTLLLISILIFISIIMFVVFTKANYPILSDEEALKIGEEKYLEFLWIVDGAFNSERMDREFTVNGQKFDKDKAGFTCIYQNKQDDTCVGNNFEEFFHNLFASKITYNQVYGDASGNMWLQYTKGKYLFTNINTCSINGMTLKQNIKIHSISNQELVFDVSYEEDANQNMERTFSLIMEDNKWKISKAYYEDLCEIKYHIG